MTAAARPRRPAGNLIPAIYCQLGAMLLVAAMRPLLPVSVWHAEVLVWLQGVSAAFLSYLLRQPIWWCWIHLLFPPALWWVHSNGISGQYGMFGFIVSALVFWRTAGGDAPLYLSSDSVADGLARLVETERAKTLVELGAGIGSVVVPLAKRLPALQITAVEQAPLPWLVLRWRCRRLSNVTVCFRNFWAFPLAGSDMVFAYLTPAVMPRLGLKCAAEMEGKSLMVSSAFVLPDGVPELVERLDDNPANALFCYRVSTLKSAEMKVD